MLNIRNVLLNGRRLEFRSTDALGGVSVGSELGGSGVHNVKDDEVDFEVVQRGR